MKNTLFIATYHNNPHFIEYQYKSFKAFIKDEWDFAVIDDSSDDTISILTGGSAKTEIRNECHKYGVDLVCVPQSIHAFVEDGGLVPHDAPDVTIHHPSERHQGCLKWIWNNYKALGFDRYKTLCLLDADAFFRKPINISEYMENYDILGTARDQMITIDHVTFPQPQEVLDIAGTRIKFYNLLVLMINMQTVKNLETFESRSFIRVTDSGGKSSIFIKNNPQYNFGYLLDAHSPENRVDRVSKISPHTDDFEIVHYNGGSCWDYQSKDYYQEKMYRMFKRYAPELLSNDLKSVGHSVISKNGSHTFEKE